MSHSQWATHRKAEVEKGSGFTPVDVYLCVNVRAQTVPFLKVNIWDSFSLTDILNTDMSILILQIFM